MRKVVSQDKIKKVEGRAKKENVSTFAIGDTVNVHCKIFEGGKERIQIFNGVVIARSGGGSREMFTVRHIVVTGEGVERKFPLHSPRIAKVEVVRSAVVNRAKLFFLRDRVGKAVRLKERRIERTTEAVKPTKAKRGKKAKAERMARKQAESEK